MLEIRHKAGLGGVLLYSVTSIYIAYLSFRGIIDPVVWNALLWVILLFGTTNAIAKSFLSESYGMRLFYYSMFHPRSVIIAKSIYNFIYMLFITLINFLIYSVLLGNVVEDIPMFTAGLILGTMALTIVLTLVSALVSRAGNSAALMAILGFPLLIPVLLTLIKFSQNAIDGLGWAVNQPYFVILLALNLLCMTLSLLLFPYLWHE